MAKDSSMRTTEVEIKAVAKAAGAALARAGHKVPHSAVLHALSAALNKRDWHKLKTAIQGLPDAAGELEMFSNLYNLGQDQLIEKEALQAQLAAFIGRAVAAERERCAATFRYWLGRGDDSSYEARCLKALADGSNPPGFTPAVQLQAAAPRFLSDNEEFAIIQEAQRRYNDNPGGASITGHIVALTQERFARANALPAPQGVHPDSSVRASRELLRQVRNYLETPGDLSRDEVGYLLSDVQTELQRLEARERTLVLDGNAYRLVDGSLQSCALLADGRISGEVDANEWYEVSEDNAQTQEARLLLEGKPAATPAAPKAPSQPLQMHSAGDIDANAKVYLASQCQPLIKGTPEVPSSYQPTLYVAGELHYDSDVYLAADIEPLLRKHKEQGAAPRTQPKVRATLRTDDRTYQVEFDATPYLAQCTVPTLLSIVQVGFSGAECTDHAAEYLLDRKLDAKVVEVFDYLHAMQKSPMKDPPGFEVTIERESFLRWMEANHRGVLAELLCAHEGIVVRELSSLPKDATDRWSWERVEGGNVTEASTRHFPDFEQAALAACETYDLMRQALQGDIL